MRKVITIDVNGHLYQLDERAYDDLRAYLAHAEARLGADPDRAEIVRDLEQSIGEKLLRYLSPEKSVVAASEVGQILQEIGPVDGVGADAPHTRAADASSGTGPAAPARRLYLIQDGAMIGGLCNGIAAYFQIDSTFVRFAFVVLAAIEMFYFERPPVVSAGLYAVLIFIVPYAKPASERTPPGTHQSIPQKVRRRVERVKAAFGGLQHHTQ
jgi:phage shock protein PspC (stress-responsive transcriptional regulator)